jgi:DNA invertase Pin-like site-specific DNA recombinase
MQCRSDAGKNPFAPKHLKEKTVRFYAMQPNIPNMRSALDRVLLNQISLNLAHMETEKKRQSPAA